MGAPLKTCKSADWGPATNPLERENTCSRPPVFFSSRMNLVEVNTAIALKDPSVQEQQLCRRVENPQPRYALDLLRLLLQGY